MLGFLWPATSSYVSAIGWYMPLDAPKEMKSNEKPTASTNPL